MDRKEFLSTGAILGAMVIAPGGRIASQIKEDPIEDDLYLDIPVSCSHEHWGSIFSIGQFPGGFNADLMPGALPQRETTLVDLLADPYMAGSLVGNGFNPLRKGQNQPVAYAELIEALKNFRLKGTFLSLRLGINLAYGYDILDLDPDQLSQINSTIAKNYGNLSDWSQSLMKKASLTHLIRPVHPEFYLNDYNSPSAKKELAYTSTVMRIDPLLDFWKKENLRRDEMADALGIDPWDAMSWRAFLEKLFNRIEEHGCLGIKQLQAYSRSLDFEPVEDQSVVYRGELNEQEKKRFQDWVVHACCELANQRKWPHQVHVGTHNHPLSNPLPLSALARRYPDQKIVMLHCWPYLEEAGYLAQSHSNVYMDTCWQPILNPEFLRQSLQSWLGYIPLNKITMSNDSTSVEMAAGASMITRKLLKESLERQTNLAGLTIQEERGIAAQLLHNNAVDIYKLGTKLTI
jgi:predicted TIM-barrel fold metal-dependent hydrolase